MSGQNKMGRLKFENNSILNSWQGEIWMETIMVIWSHVTSKRQLDFLRAFQKFKLSRVAILIASKHNINSKVKESEDSIVFDGSTSVATYVATSESKVKISN